MERVNAMSVLPFLVFVSIAMSGFGLIAFVWSVKNGQMDDLKSPGKRVVGELDE